MYSYATEGCRFSHDTPVSSIKNQNCHNYYEQLYYILFVCSYTVFNPVGKIFVIFNNLKIFFNNLVTREADSPFAHIFRSWCPLYNIYCQFYSSILWSFDIYLFFHYTIFSEICIFSFSPHFHFTYFGLYLHCPKGIFHGRHICFLIWTKWGNLYRTLHSCALPNFN